MANYAKDLHRQGRMLPVYMMEDKANNVIKGTKGGLAHAFITEGYEGSDCFAIIANSPKYENKTGYVVFDEDEQKAVFIAD